MIAACPTCDARYRIDVTKLRPEGARLRCARCENVFRVQAPEAPAAAAPAVPEPAVVTPVAAPPAAVSPIPAATPAPDFDGEEHRNRDRLVLIASPEIEEGKEIAGALTSWGFEPILVHDGVEAILSIQRSLPRVVILDAALPKMFGFQVCELMKRNESLREIKVILVGAIHDQSRYRRPAQEIYGADAYAERQELLGVLESLIRNFNLSPGSTRDPVPPVPVQAPVASPVRPTPAIARTAPPARVAATSGGPVQSPEREKAERLARIIVSDIILYNQERFDAAVLAGNVTEALAAELAEGTALFAGRVAPGLGNAQDFLSQELLRMARSRGMN